MHGETLKFLFQLFLCLYITCDYNEGVKNIWDMTSRSLVDRYQHNRENLKYRKKCFA